MRCTNNFDSTLVSSVTEQDGLLWLGIPHPLCDLFKLGGLISLGSPVSLNRNPAKQENLLFSTPLPLSFYNPIS